MKATAFLFPEDKNAALRRPDIAALRDWFALDRSPVAGLDDDDH